MVQEAASICITDYSSELLNTPLWNIQTLFSQTQSVFFDSFFHNLFLLFKQTKPDRLDYEKLP